MITSIRKQFASVIESAKDSGALLTDRDKIKPYKKEEIASMLNQNDALKKL